MKFRNPFFVENVMQDQPYCSLLLVAPYCDGACPGCHNAELGDTDVEDFSVEEMVAIYKGNPFVDGITVAGLEICLSGDDFITDLVSFVARAEIPRVTIYSRFPRTHVRLAAILERLQSLGCVREVYCKTGPYQQGAEARQVVLQNAERPDKTWTISLASGNQDFHVVKGATWEPTAA